ncbi:hypothetical protein EXVG_00186 [Emiliania huxleyi virus 202]|nr:hypothetical protein EXVG_00186 [Emiliania huxleyi virus 202]AHA54196.1 hypothetical protein EhV18_00149 [Emiliania huxleyi virus 18]
MYLWLRKQRIEFTWLTYASHFSASAAQSKMGMVALATSRVLHALMTFWFARLLVRRPPSVTLRQLSATLFIFPALLAWNTGMYFDAALIFATLSTSLVIHRPRPHFPEDSGVADVFDPIFARLWAFRCVCLSVWYGIPSGIFSLCLVSCCYSATRILPYNSSIRNATHAAMHVFAVAGSVCVINIYQNLQPIRAPTAGEQEMIALEQSTS